MTTTMHQGPKHIIGIVGWSGSGKTTLLSDLIPVLTERGYTVSTMKHTHHDFDMDRPGKDSYRHREAGAKEVLLTSRKRWALLHELRDEPEYEIDALIAQMAAVDILLIEGFKSHKYPKIEVNRPSRGKDLLCLTDDSVVAVATDDRFDGVGVVQIDLNDVEAVADYIVSYLRLEA
ncbi:molybdopterin-guanine dinucleotide biosynthesis protein B [Magnetovibrio sp.]|uniref:molybdopterin-guanine dinucleotide biosynthesis protein B n=1 Tax=Magnetovibrio sp. TaxID=2024836 RepID=UPI002F95EBB9